MVRDFYIAVVIFFVFMAGLFGGQYMTQKSYREVLTPPACDAVCYVEHPSDVVGHVGIGASDSIVLPHTCPVDTVVVRVGQSRLTARDIEPCNHCDSIFWGMEHDCTPHKAGE
ncbi:hypothetical protein KAR91_16150 [Candidatus Pacearchaeota archaeon]|nr:hypothetical protein [Candidatus Pacearchaeota archaeon]